MKKSNLILPVMLVLSLISVSCTEKTDDPNSIDVGTKETLLTRFEMSTAIGSQATSISYTNDLLPEIVKESEQNVVKLARKFTYQVSKLISAKLYSDEAMATEIGNENYTYNSSGQLISKTVVNGGETKEYIYSWTSGRLTQVEGITVGASFADFKKIYEWNGDNITKVTNYTKDSVGTYAMSGYDVYTFDSKVNPLSIKTLPDFEESLYLNKNNATKIEFYDSYGVIQGMANFTYTFDAKDRPLTGTFDFAYMSGLYVFTYTELTKQ